MKKFLVSIALVLLTFVGVALLGAQGVEHSRGNMFSNLLFLPDNTYDIGASGATRPRTGYFGTSVVSPFFTATSTLMAQVSGSTKLSVPSDGVLTFTNQAATDFTRLQLGGTTSSFPALKRNSASLEARLADDSARANFNAATINASSYVMSTAGVLLISTTAPTISSGFGTSPSIVANGTAAFIVNVGTGAVATSGVLAMPTATTGWACYVNNLTGRANHIANQETFQTASTTTTVTLENQTISTGGAAAWAASDILRVSCFAY